MNTPTIFAVLTLSLLVSCSKFKRVSTSEPATTKSSGLNELEGLEGLEEFEDEKILTESSPNEETVLLVEEQIEEPMQEQEEELMMMEEPKKQVMRPTIKKETIARYTVQAGDTLMLISYKLYGHHKEWKSIYQMNRNAIGNRNNLKVGTEISYYPPSNPPPAPEGIPYLIRKGDSLSSISGKVYGDIKLWRPIYENNRYSIDNPNLIFAGFTIYYPEKSSQTVASY